MTIAVDLGRKATKPTNQPKLYRNKSQQLFYYMSKIRQVFYAILNVTSIDTTARPCAIT